MRTKVGLFCDKLIEAGWLAALVVVPLFFNIQSNRVFEPDKLSLLRSIALVMAAAWLVRLVEDWRVRPAGGRGEDNGPSPWRRLFATPLVLPTLALVLIYLVSTALSISPRVSLLGSYQRLQGTYTTLSYIVIFFLLLQGLRTKKQLDRILITAILVSFPVALYGLIQHFGLDPLPWGGDVESRAASNMGNAIFVAAYLIMVVPLTIARLLENWKEALGDLEMRDGLLGVVAFVLLAAALLVGMLLPVGEGQDWIRWLALLVGVALQIPIYFLSPPQRRPQVLTITLPLTFAFLVGFSWILEIFFPPVSASYLWLGLVAAILFLVAMVAFAYYLRKPVGRLVLLGAYFIIVVAQLVCIFYTQSRGPLLGLLAGLFFFLALLGLVKRQAWLPWLMSALALGVAIFLIMFNTLDSPLMDKLRQTRYVGRLGRVLETESGTGKVRVLIWEGATELVGWHPPLISPGEDGGPDPFNALRPILGYGPESMYVAYNRFYPPELGHFEKRNASPDRSHNETFDALVTTGGVGTLIYMALFGSVFYYGFQWLGLVRKRWQPWAFAGLLVAGAILGAVGTWAWRGPAYVGVGIPIGALVGVAIFILISLVLATFKPQWRVPPARYQIWILALLAAILAHFVEIQFGIAIAATRTYFWIMAATMVVVGTRFALQGEQGESAAAPATAHHAETGAARPRKRNVPAAPPSRSTFPQGRRSLLVLSVLAMLILSTMFYNSITPQEGDPGALTTVWKSLTASKDGSSPIILVLLLSTWGMIGLVGLTELDLAGDKPERNGAGWSAAVGVFALISLGGALIFALFHATNLRPVTLSALETSNPLANTITLYYVALLLDVLALALILAFFSRRWQGAPGWRWTGRAADVALAAAVLILPVLLVFLIATSNLSIVRADIVYKQGLSSEKTGGWDAAIYLYQEATRLAPDEDFYYLFLGRAAMEKGKDSEGEQREIWLQESESALQKAREIAPLNTDHSRNLSKLYLSWATLSTGEGRADLFERSLELSADAVALSPNTADIWNERAQVYAAMGDYEGALDTYRQSLEQDDKYVQTYLALAQLYTQQQEFDEAVAALKQVIELSPRSADAYSLLGYAYSQEQDDQAAVEAYEQAVDLRPQHYLDQKNLAILYNQVGRTEDAIAAATRALAQAPEAEKASLETFLAQLGAVSPGS
ncbi:MAG TPA: tetratricopeptide repeat protein, partial [Anaerolineae bacterium]|nr:tetratricopeptide repeat protein [Anaerolineae bacterium]